MHLSMYSPTSPPSGIHGAIVGELTLNFSPTLGHLTHEFYIFINMAFLHQFRCVLPLELAASPWGI